MTDEPTPQSRTSLGKIAVLVVGVLALVIVGAIVARSSTEPVRADLPGAQASGTAGGATTPATTATAANDPTTPKRTPLAGSGAPLSVSGTSPVTGAPTTLAALKGTPVVLMIWASWCPGCNEEAPHLAKVAKQRSDVAFFGINYRDSAGEAKDFYAKYGWTLPSVEDRNGEMSIGLGLQGTPTTIFLDARHREVGRVTGALDEAGLNDAIDQLVGA